MDARDGASGRHRDPALLAGLGLVYAALHLLFITRYGWFRDELYYIACSDHPAWGYVDHPPLSIAVLGAIRAVAGDSLPAVRLAPALAGAACVALAGLLARGMGAGRYGQTLAAVCVGVAPVFLFTTHVYSMNAFDLLLWTLIALALLPILKGGGGARWLLVGALIGLGLLNKLSVAWLGLGLAAAMLLTPLRRHLATRWPWLGAGLAGLIVLPHVAWQAANGWPTLEFMRNATLHKMADVGTLDFLKMQLEALHPLGAPVWAGGFLFVMLSRAGRSWRPFGWIFLTVFLLLMASGRSRASYLAPAFPMMLAAGGVAAERLLTRRGARWLRPVSLAALLAGGAITAPLTLPVLSPETLVRYAAAIGAAPHQEERSALGALPQHFADMFGWEDLEAAVARVYGSLPPADRARCAIFTENYGEAGAIDLFGKRHGLPRAISKHNNYWLWGPGDHDGSVMILVGGDRADEEAAFREVTQAGVFDCVWCMPYENGRPIWLVRGPRTDLRPMWPSLKDFI